MKQKKLSLRRSRISKAGLRRTRKRPRVPSRLRTTQPVAVEPAGGAVSPVSADSMTPLRRKERPWIWYVASALTVVFLIGFSLFVFRLTTTIEQQNQQLIVTGRAFRELNSRFIELRNELTRKEELLRVLSARRIEVASLNGIGVSPAAFGRIFWDAEKRSAFLQLSNLPVAPEGKEYQLWLSRGKLQTSAGVFAVTVGGSSFFRIEHLPVLGPGGPYTFVVTLEQKGGSTHPTGALYLTGPAQ